MMHYQNERKNLGIHSGDESEYLIKKTPQKQTMSKKLFPLCIRHNIYKYLRNHNIDIYLKSRKVFFQ